MSDTFDYERHERLRERVANDADSVLWTFKAYYKAGSYYSNIGKLLDAMIFISSAFLTLGIIWRVTPNIILIILALVSAITTGYRRAASPEDRAEEFYRAANSYHRLFDEFREFIVLELSDESNSVDSMESEFKQLSSRRRDLNEDTPDITSKWYDKLDESIYSEVSTEPGAKEKLTGEADLRPSDPQHDLSSEEVKEKLTKEADLSK